MRNGFEGGLQRKASEPLMDFENHDGGSSGDHIVNGSIDSSSTTRHQLDETLREKREALLAMMKTKKRNRLATQDSEGTCECSLRFLTGLSIESFQRSVSQANYASPPLFSILSSYSQPLLHRLKLPRRKHKSLKHQNRIQGRAINPIFSFSSTRVSSEVRIDMSN